ncbi:hypothetical protein [Vibrio variabilis]|uniref:hypothetical protein n=1 Tax=Vibrio variabilis TaxID=990271 RepID=UPI0013A6DFDF|nr:hypothetical protein [Vibrio variabilis]
MAFWHRQHDQNTRAADNCQSVSAETFIPEEYISQLKGDWIRLFYRDQLVYGHLYSALHYIMRGALFDVARWVESRFPYQLQRDCHLLPHNSTLDPKYYLQAHFGHESVRPYFTAHCSDWLSHHYPDFMLDLHQQLEQQTPLALSLSTRTNKVCLVSILSAKTSKACG